MSEGQTSSSQRKVGGSRGNAGKGRRKGVPNKTTALLKDALLKAAENAGGKDGMVGYLTQQAQQNPQSFLPLLGKVLPMQLVGRDDGPLKIEITRRIVGGEQ